MTRTSTPPCCATIGHRRLTHPRHTFSPSTNHGIEDNTHTQPSVESFSVTKSFTSFVLANILFQIYDASSPWHCCTLVKKKTPNLKMVPCYPAGEGLTCFCIEAPTHVYSCSEMDKGCCLSWNHHPHRTNGNHQIVMVDKTALKGTDIPPRSRSCWKAAKHHLCPNVLASAPRPWTQDPEPPPPQTLCIPGVFGLQVCPL